MNVRCPACGEAVALAVGDTRLACVACGLATPVSRVGTEPGAALVALERDLKGMEIAGRQVIERIGAGGMGTVYRARDAGGGEVAIKVLRPGLGTDRAVVLARFTREAEALRRLDHPRVVRFLGHGQEGEVAYIVTELVPGRDLAARLGAGRMSLPEIADVFGQVCDGVAAAHAAGIVHRDLKPANILVSDSGAVKVADFGLAQLGPDSSITTLTRTDVAMGTFHYLAPEQRKDARNVDHRADIWALGVILYEMLTGELPLGSFAPPSDRRADAIVRRALSPDPAARFGSVDELGRAVRALVAPRRRPRVWIAAAVALVIAMGTAGAVAMSGGGGDGEGRAPMVNAAETMEKSKAKDSKAETVPRVATDAAITLAAVDAAAPAPSDKPPPEVVKRPTFEGKGETPSKPSTVTKRSVGKPSAGKVEKPSVRKPVDVGADEDDDAGDAPAGDAPPEAKAVRRDIPTKGKAKQPDKPAPLAICRQATRCCQVTKGSKCSSFLDGDTGTCTKALEGFRGRATNPKQQAACR